MSSRDEIMARLSELGIQYEHYTHEPVQAAADRYSLDLAFDARVCKNLLVATRSESRFLLLMIPFEKSVDLKGLRDAFKTSRLQFAPEARLAELLNQEQGTVGVCGVIHDCEKCIEVVFDTSLRENARIAMHPGVNTETVVMSFSELERYVRSCGTKVWIYEF
jgi:Uncharacterized conserved protein